MKQVAFSEVTTNLTLTKLAKLEVHEDNGTPAVASFTIEDEATGGAEVLHVELAANESVLLNFGTGSLDSIASDTEADTLHIASATGQFTGTAFGY